LKDVIAVEKTPLHTPRVIVAKSDWDPIKPKICIALLMKNWQKNIDINEG